MLLIRNDDELIRKTPMLSSTLPLSPVNIELLISLTVLLIEFTAILNIEFPGNSMTLPYMVKSLPSKAVTPTGVIAATSGGVVLPSSLFPQQVISPVFFIAQLCSHPDEIL